MNSLHVYDVLLSIYRNYDCLCFGKGNQENRDNIINGILYKMGYNDPLSYLKEFKNQSDLLETRKHPTKHLRIPACQVLLLACQTEICHLNHLHT